MFTPPTTIDVPLRTDEHGKIRVGETRVLLELVIHAFLRGETAESIVDSYPTLKLGDVYAVLAYYLTHQEDVDEYVHAAEAAGDRIQAEIEANYTPETRALLDRLRAMRDAKRRNVS